MRIVAETISLKELRSMAKDMFVDLVKVVVDVEKEVIAVYAELHADEEALLLCRGSEQKNLWGINLYPEFFGKKEFVQFDSMINVRPSQDNMSRGVEKLETREKIRRIVNKIVTEE